MLLRRVPLSLCKFYYAIYYVILSVYYVVNMFYPDIYPDIGLVYYAIYYVILGKIVCQRFFNLGFDFVIDRVAVEDPFAL